MLHSYCSLPLCLFCYQAGNHLPLFSCTHSLFNSCTNLFLSYNAGSCYSYTDPKVLHSYKPSPSKEVQPPQFFFFLTNPSFSHGCANQGGHRTLAYHRVGKHQHHPYLAFTNLLRYLLQISSWQLFCLLPYACQLHKQYNAITL